MYFPTDDSILDLSGESFPPYLSVEVEGSPCAASEHQTAAVTLSATHTHTALLHYTFLQWLLISHPAKFPEKQHWEL